MHLEDEAYIHSLRTDQSYNEHLSTVTGSAEDQRNWIVNYKEREASGSEYYFIVERKDGVRCGVVRLYDINGDQFNWGSWILDHNKPRKAALESALLSFGFGFEAIGLTAANVEVRVNNTRAVAFYRRFNMTETHRTEQDIFFLFPRMQFDADKGAYRSILESEDPNTRTRHFPRLAPSSGHTHQSGHPSPVTHSPRQLRVKKYDAVDRVAWDEFVIKSKNSHFMFLRDYIEYHSDRFNDYSLIVTNDANNVIGILPANLNDHILHSHQGLTFGGLCIKKNATITLVLEMFEKIIEFLQDNTTIKKIIYKRLPDFYSTYPAQEDLYALFSLRAVLIRRDLSSAIDMREPLPIRKGRLGQVKKARRENVLIEQINHLDSFWTLLHGVLNTRHGANPVHTIAEIQALRDIFPENLKCFIAKKEGITVAGTLVYVTDRVAHTQYMASNSVGRDVGALDLIVHNLITEVFSDKTYFDLGISTQNKGWDLNSGLIAQKEGFGARAFVHDFYEIEIA